MKNIIKKDYIKKLATQQKILYTPIVCQNIILIVSKNPVPLLSDDEM